MALEKSLVQEVVAAIRSISPEPAVAKEPDGTFLEFGVNDLLVRFRKAEKTTFDTILFPLFGQHVIVAANLQPMIVNQKGETHYVDSPALENSIAVYLQWRLGILRNFKI